MTPQQRQAYRAEIAKADQAIQTRNIGLTALPGERLPTYSELASALRDALPYVNDGDINDPDGQVAKVAALLARIPT